MTKLPQLYCWPGDGDPTYYIFATMGLGEASCHTVLVALCHGGGTVTVLCDSEEAGVKDHGLIPVLWSKLAETKEDKK